MFGFDIKEKIDIFIISQKPNKIYLKKSTQYHLILIMLNLSKNMCDAYC